MNFCVGCASVRKYVLAFFFQMKYAVDWVSIWFLKKGCCFNR